MADKVKKIIFLNSPSEVDDYLASNRRDFDTGSSDCLFIAMNPVARSYLKQKKIPVQDTTPYFTTESHKSTLERSKIILDWLRQEAKFLDLGFGIRQAYKDSLILITRCSILYCLWTIETVLNTIALHNPQIMCASYSGHQAVSSLFIELEEKYLGYIVKMIAKERKLKFEDIPASPLRNFATLKKFSDYSRALVKFTVGSQRFRFWQKKILRNIPHNERPILFTSRFYQMGELITKFQSELKDRAFYALSYPIIASFDIPDFAFKMFWRKYSDEIIGQKMSFKVLERSVATDSTVFSYRNISFCDVIAQKTKSNIANFIIGLYLWSILLDKFLDDVKPSAVVTNGNRFDDEILAELCNRKNIPDILVSHGSHIPPKNRYENIEWQENNRALMDGPFSHIALQSPLAEEYLKIYPPEGRTIRTGPLVWGTAVNLEKSRALFKKLFGAKYEFKDVKVLVHAGTPKQTKALRLYVYETPDEYVRSICDLVNAVNEIPNTVLIIRFRASQELDTESLKRLVPFSEKVILSRDESFIDVLGLADLLVSFSSTTIEEALQNRIPVLLYGGNGRYQHIPAYEIKSDDSIQPSAVYHIGDAQCLKNAIRNILNLDIDSKKNSSLFEPYIYTYDVRTSLAGLLKSYCDEGKQR